jgi:DNA-directed RNA polymerase specialized sigma24 family protein
MPPFPPTSGDLGAKPPRRPAEVPEDRGPRKTVEKNRHFARQKNDRGRVQSLDQLGPADEEPLADRSPTPERAASAREEWDRLLAGQPEYYRRILELLRDGHTYLEVAELLPLHRKTVQRVVGLVRWRAAGKPGTAGA